MFNFDYFYQYHYISEDYRYSPSVNLNFLASPSILKWLKYLFIFSKSICTQFEMHPQIQPNVSTFNTWYLFFIENPFLFILYSSLFYTFT